MGTEDMGQNQTKAIILKGLGDHLAYWKPLRSGRRAFRFDGMFTRETSLSFARASAPAANAAHAPGALALARKDRALISLQDLRDRRGA